MDLSLSRRETTRGKSMVKIGIGIVGWIGDFEGIFRSKFIDTHDGSVCMVD